MSFLVIFTEIFEHILFRDHGAIIFLDNRFCEEQARTNLSGWLKPFLQKHTQMGTAIKGLASFFKTDSLIGRQREEVVAAQTALIHKNNASKKRKRVDVKFEDEGAGGSAETSLQNVAEMYKGEGIENKAPKSIYDESTSGISFNQTSSMPSDQEWEFRKPLPPPPKSGPKGLPKKRLKIVKGLPKTGAKVLQSVSNSKPGSSGKII